MKKKLFIISSIVLLRAFILSGCGTESTDVVSGEPFTLKLDMFTDFINSVVITFFINLF